MLDVSTPAEGTNPPRPRDGTIPDVATLRLFASAREAAGTGRVDLPGDTVGQLLALATERFGEAFVRVLGSCSVWVNGESATTDTHVDDADEVAILPPVSGGALDPLDSVDRLDPRRDPTASSRSRHIDERHGSAHQPTEEP